MNEDVLGRLESMVKVISAGDLAPLRDVTDCKEHVNKVWDMFKESDIGIVNLEMPLTHSNEKTDKAINFKADPKIAYSLSEAGIDVVSFANNHAYDYGAKGLMDTIDSLNEANVAVVGAGETITEAFKPVIQYKDGLKIAHIGICSALPTGFAANDDKPGVAPVRARSRFYIDSVTLDEQPGMSPWVETSVVEDDLNDACKKIEAIKIDVDVIIAQVHWGVPNGWCAQFQGPLADYQQPMAHRLIDAGVDIIMGHHPHVVHGVEKYNDGVIAYSLGNFLFHSMSDDHETTLTTKYPPYNVDSLETGEAREAVVMETTIKQGKITDIRFYPTVLNNKGEPEFLEGEGAVAVLKRMQKQSHDLHCDLVIDGIVGKMII